MRIASGSDGQARLPGGCLGLQRPTASVPQDVVWEVASRPEPVRPASACRIASEGCLSGQGAARTLARRLLSRAPYSSFPSISVMRR